MAVAGNSVIDWVALGNWYLSAGSVISKLETSCAVARRFPAGSAVSNLALAHGLSTLIWDSELWLLEHPCPESWNQRYVEGILEVLAAIGEVVTATNGFVEPADVWVLDNQIEGACEKVERLRSISAAVAATGRL